MNRTQLWIATVVNCLPFPGQVDALRLRLEEKEATLNKKSKQIQEMSEEKGTLNGEIHDLKDMLEVKERKVNVLQKKVMWTKSGSKDLVLSLCERCIHHVIVHVLWWMFMLTGGCLCLLCRLRTFRSSLGTKRSR